MIADARALDPSYVPSDLHHRDAKVSQLAGALRPITAGDCGEHAFIFGPSGTGKTTLAKFVARELERKTLGFRWGYHNCISGSSRAHVLHGLSQDAGLGADLQKEGASSSEFLDRFRSYGEQLVLIIDEVDVLEDQLTLQALYGISNVTLVMVTIDEDDLFARLDERLRSRFRSSKRVYLERYCHDELCDILRGRIRAGLKPGVIEPRAIEYIADAAAGDARHAIALLREATRHAMNTDESLITIETVDAVHEGAYRGIHQSRVEDLGTHKRLLYEIIRKADEIPATELHATYEERAQDPKPRRTKRRYLSTLETKYELIISRGVGKGKVYAVSDF